MGAKHLTIKFRMQRPYYGEVKHHLKPRVRPSFLLLRPSFFLFLNAPAILCENGVKARAARLLALFDYHGERVHLVPLLLDVCFALIPLPACCCQALGPSPLGLADERREGRDLLSRSEMAGWERERDEKRERVREERRREVSYKVETQA